MSLLFWLKWCLYQQKNTVKVLFFDFDTLCIAPCTVTG